MRTKKIEFPLIVPKRTSGKVPVPEHLPSLHGIQIWVGRRNAGKSVAATSLIKRYIDAGAIERVILVSPELKTLPTSASRTATRCAAATSGSAALSAF